MDFGDPGWKHIALLLFLTYWALCRSLRYRRANLIANKFRGRDPYSLTIDEAQWIVDQITTKEMSKISRFSTAFALFRTYGIVSIAPLLMKTSQLLTVKTGARRYVDTGVLIRDFTSFPFNSERHAKALARMNWLHSRYNISNDDMLYTLSVFVTSPDKWLGLYDWRGLTELEVSAWWILWREIGHEMGIHSIPRTYPEIRAWSTTYESRAMIPSPTSHQLAEITTSLLIYYQPSFLKPLAKKLIIGLMDERLREAMMYPRQGRWVYWFILGFFEVRKVWLRNFALPRWRGVYYTSEKENEFGRFVVNYADNEPWYLPPDKVGPISRFLNTLSGIPNPSPQYKMEGYLHEDVGPPSLEGHGREKMAEDVERIMKMGEERIQKRGGCPMAFSS